MGVVRTVPEPSLTRSQGVGAGVVSVLAWSLDLFDLFLLLYVASTIAPLFFPSSATTLSLAYVYVGFGFTLLFRPLGAVLFGPFADRRGRRVVMVITLCGSGGSIALLGALPTLQEAGAIAPILFYLLRIVQGIFVGGVVASSHTLGTESIPPRWHGLMSGFIGGGGAAIGGAIASLVYLVTSTIFPGALFAVWGWRVTFFCGLLSVILAVIVATTVRESPRWEQRKVTPARRAPLGAVVGGHLGALLLNVVVVAGAGTCYYLTSGYLPTFLAKVNGLPGQATGWILLLANLVILFSALLFGHLSQHLGRRPTFLVIGVMDLIVLPIAFLLLGRLSSHQATLPIVLLVLVLTFGGNAAYAPVQAFLAERFPTVVRSTGAALSWNVGFAIGGIQTSIVTAASGGLDRLPAFLAIWLAAASVLYLLGAIFTPETKGRVAAA
ncbi:MAG: MFS transporter [Candidatus Dormibacteraceae bacterium]